MLFKIFLALCLIQFWGSFAFQDEPNKDMHSPPTQPAEEMKKKLEKKRSYEENIWLNEDPQKPRSTDFEIDFGDYSFDFTPEGIRKAAKTLLFDKDESLTNSGGNNAKGKSNNSMDNSLVKVLDEINTKLERPITNKTAFGINHDYEIEPIKPELLTSFFDMKPNKTKNTFKVLSTSSVIGTDESKALNVSSNVTKSINDPRTTKKPDMSVTNATSRSLDLNLKKPTSKHARVVTTTYKPSVQSKANHNRERKTKNKTPLKKMKPSSNPKTNKNVVSSKPIKTEAKTSGNCKLKGDKSRKKPSKISQKMSKKDRQKKILKNFLNQLNMLNRLTIFPRNSTDFQELLTIVKPFGSKFSSNKLKKGTSKSHTLTSGFLNSDNDLKEAESYLKNIFKKYAVPKKKANKMNQIIESSLFSDGLWN